jgi:general secretion pathway protein A
MYLDFYQLKQAPFPSTPEPAYLFLSPSHQQALATITSGVTERHGFVLITGIGGVGKTTILRAYLAREHPTQLTLLVIANAQVTFPELLTTLCQACGLEATGLDHFAMQTQFQQFLLAEYRQGRNMAILIDDAHRMPLATLDQLWLLANLDIAAAKVVQIILFGQPELEQRLHRYALRHIAQRIAVRATIAPLTKAESYAYIRESLAHAALPGRPIFTRGALTCLVRAARGVPRLLAHLCTQALVTGCSLRQRPITARLARAVVRAECPRVPSAPRWSLGLAVAAGILLVTGSLWFTLRGPLHQATGPESTQPLAPAGTPAPQHAQEPLTVSPSLQPSLDSTAIPPRGTSELPIPPPSGEPVAVPPSLPTGEVHQEAASSSSTGETTTPSAATPVGEPQPAPVAGTTETQASLPQGEETTSVRLPRTVIFKRGDSLWKLALKTYGFVDTRLLQLIREQNPHLKNLDIIPIDTKLVLPVLEQQRAKGQ